MRRDWRQEEGLGESAIDQTRNNEHTRDGSGQEDGVEGTGVIAFKGNLEMEKSPGKQLGF